MVYKIELYINTNEEIGEEGWDYAIDDVGGVVLYPIDKEKDIKEVCLTKVQKVQLKDLLIKGDLL